MATPSTRTTTSSGSARSKVRVRGLQRLAEDDIYCVDILTQIASVNAALQKVALGLVDQHLRHCVMDAMDAEPEVGPQRVTDATLAVRRLLQL